MEGSEGREGLWICSHVQNGIFVIESTYRVFIKYCVFSKILKYSGLCFSLFSLGVSVCTLYTHQAGRKPALPQNW